MNYLARFVRGGVERYQFTWPDKRLHANLALTKTTNTLRPCIEESKDFENTKNLYIEGDNLEVLKILRNTYQGKIKVIYIDPPYNTGNDFVYKDCFSIDKGSFEQLSGCFDDNGNQQISSYQRNLESNGRFHTDWLNMIYPRLKVARDLLTDDGVIFISIDEHEADKLKTISDEIFGQDNFRNKILVRRRSKSLNLQFADNGLKSFNVGYEYVFVYSKTNQFLFNPIRYKKLNFSDKGKWNVFWSNADRPTMRYDILGYTPTSGQWRWQQKLANEAVENYRIYIKDFSSSLTLEEYWLKTGKSKQFIRRIDGGKGKNGGVQYWVGPSDSSLRTSNWLDLEISQIAKDFNLPFENPKSTDTIKTLLSTTSNLKDCIYLDFFSGSATTAHAVMQLNAEDGGKRKFVMVQLPESCDEKSEAYKSGFKNICEIGKERIRRAGEKIKAENPNAKDLDVGFRVFKLDSSNMRDVEIYPHDVSVENLFEDNIKSERSSEDLLIQVMLKKGIELSSKITEKIILNNKVFFVEDNYLIATFDFNVSNEVIKEIAKLKPVYFVMRDASALTDDVKDNFEQLFKMYSKDSIVEVI